MKKKSTTATFNEDAPITQGDIDAGKLVLRRRVAGRAVPAKKRVTLYLDTTLVERFKGMAGERGYQTLINETLKTSLQQGDIESTIRSAIREELNVGNVSAALGDKALPNTQRYLMKNRPSPTVRTRSVSAGAKLKSRKAA